MFNDILTTTLSAVIINIIVSQAICVKLPKHANLTTTIGLMKYRVIDKIEKQIKYGSRTKLNR